MVVAREIFPASFEARGRHQVADPDPPPAGILIAAHGNGLSGSLLQEPFRKAKRFSFASPRPALQQVVAFNALLSRDHRFENKSNSTVLADF